MRSRGKALVIDPLKFAAACWPDIHFYAKQREVIYSVVENRETFVVAGNMLGKDFVSGFLVVYFFLTRHPVRIVTTSADHSQLESVLWGEIRNFIQTSRVPLSSEHGGPILVNHLHLRRMIPPRDPKTGAFDPTRGLTDVCGRSYCIARVAAKGEGMLGHHIEDVGDDLPRTLFMADEASGVEDIAYQRADTWADRKLIIGNPYQCNNFFRTGVKDGDLIAR